MRFKFFGIVERQNDRFGVLYTLENVKPLPTPKTPLKSNFGALEHKETLLAELEELKKKVEEYEKRLGQLG